jgi:GT2 family glycosyltransferase
MSEQGPDATTTPAVTPAAMRRPGVRGRFLFAGDVKLWVRGVTYGTFRPGAGGRRYHPEVVESDFAAIAANGFNAVRTYTVPPRWLLDAARRHGLRVMVGLPWEQHVAFLDDRRRARDIEARVRDGVAACAGHPAVLCYAVGNEIPAPIVRWHGARAIERWLDRLVTGAKREDPRGLMTYVNYPTTEYLRLDALDLVCFNVYLESEERLEAYLARLHNLAGERPLILAEIGLDSRRNGQRAQARALAWQVRAAFASGCAGTFVFAWTDEWHRGGHDIEDWDFGLTDRRRAPKPALAGVRHAMAESPIAKHRARWPRISVVVCSFNGARTIRECLDGLLRLEYPDVEVIVVDDGSTDATASIARAYPFRLISTPNRGLSAARNTGLAEATGEIVAYIDDDASPDPHWLTYLAATYATTTHAVVGGPNIPPPGDGWVAECVANAPGGPTHVLISDREAEHLPGCNLSFRKECLAAIGGFDRTFRVAGDDVDACWRIQARGWTLGFNAAAMVWHHRRGSVRAYYRQQRGYGRAEALLERKWPEKYNTAGNPSWGGRIYGGLAQALGFRRGRIYHGTWGSALFQSIYEPAPGLLASLPAMPEWYNVILALAAFSTLGVLWRPLLALALPLLVCAIGASLVQATRSAMRARLREAPAAWWGPWRSRALIAVLNLLQPLARLVGRTGHGLTPWRRRGAPSFAVPLRRKFAVWTEHWRAPAAKLAALEAALRASGYAVVRGGDFDRWDLEVRGGALGTARLRMATEEHGAGRQLWRFRVWPRWCGPATTLTVLLAALTGGAAHDGAWSAAVALGAAGMLVALRALDECGTAMAAFLDARALIAETSEATGDERTASSRVGQVEAA